MEYIPKSERGKENPATFIIRALTSGDCIEIDNAMIDYDKDGKTKINVGETKFVKFRVALTGWRAVKVDGVEAEYNDDNKKKIPLAWYNEIVEEINKLSMLSESERKD